MSQRSWLWLFWAFFCFQRVRMAAMLWDTLPFALLGLMLITCNCIGSGIPASSTLECFQAPCRASRLKYSASISHDGGMTNIITGVATPHRLQTNKQRGEQKSGRDERMRADTRHPSLLDWKDCLGNLFSSRQFITRETLSPFPKHALSHVYAFSVISDYTRIMSSDIMEKA